MSFLITVMVSLGVAFALGEFFRRMGFPVMVGQILAGVLVSLPLISQHVFRNDLTDLGLIAQLGIVFLMLIAGLETDYTKLKKSSHDILIVSVLSAVLPFALGFLLTIMLGYSYIAATVVAACLSMTAVGTNLPALIDLKLLNTKVGRLIVGSGIADDLFEILFLSMILIIAQKGGYAEVIALPLKILGFVVLVYIIVKLIPMLINAIVQEHSESSEFMMIILLALFIAAISTLFGLGPIVGAFAAGLMIRAIMNKTEERKMVKDLSVIGFGFVVPFFFINIGMNFDVRLLLGYWPLMLVIALAAIMGKLLAALLSSPFTHLDYRQSMILGWGLNSRGAVELVIAEVARLNGIINLELYAAIVVMALVSTILSPLVLPHYVKKYPTLS